MVRTRSNETCETGAVHLESVSSLAFVGVDLALDVRAVCDELITSVIEFRELFLDKVVGKVAGGIEERFEARYFSEPLLIGMDP
jgi:hypothetical protein